MFTPILLFIALIFFFYFVLYLNSESYILKNGQKTEGIITSVQSRSQTDRYGRVHVRYIVSYRFQDTEESVYRGKFTIHSSTCRFKEEDKVEVYYLPDKPYKNTASRRFKLK